MCVLPWLQCYSYRDNTEGCVAIVTVCGCVTMVIVLLYQLSLGGVWSYTDFVCGCYLGSISFPAFTQLKDD